MIPFNKPYITGKEIQYIKETFKAGSLTGNGKFTKKCHDFFEIKYGFKKVLLTTSCTDALEMSALLLDIKSEDEVIIPSYTFVSTANAFVSRGANVKFADSESQTPNIDAEQIESLITSKTKAIIVVHYGGIACDMDKIMTIANKHNLYVIEDAAQAIDSFYKKQRLGSIGHLATFSFHETKNIISGEGGMLVINDEKFIKRAEIIWEKGTNRTAFHRGEVNKYQWMDLGSSFLPSDITAAFLLAQLEHIDHIQHKRIKTWNTYGKTLKPLENTGAIQLPFIPDYATINGHLYYILCKNLQEKDQLLKYLNDNNIKAVFHYLPLHKSPFFKKKYGGEKLPNVDKYSDCLIRLPIFYELTTKDVAIICNKVEEFFD